MFRRIVEALSPRLMSMTYSFTRDQDEARDLLQETWIRAYEKRHQYGGRGSLVGWLYSIGRSVCLDALAKRKRREELDFRATDSPSFDSSDQLDHRVDLRCALHSAFADLPPRERDVVWARLVSGLSTRETAKLLGCAEGTIKATLHHALGKIKISMEEWVT